MHGGFGLDANGIATMKYLVLAREDLTNQVEGRTLANKTTLAISKFVFEEVVCQYRCVGMIVANRGELDAHKGMNLLKRLGVKPLLTTAYNPKVNGKIERGDWMIVKSIVRTCDGRVGI